MATTRAASIENGTSFEDFIKTLETSSDEWARGGAKIGKKGKQRKNKKSVKDESNLCQDLKESYFDQKVIDLRCRETCVLPCFSGIVAKTSFQLFELPDDFYFSITKTSQWLGKITDSLFDIRPGVVARGSQGFLNVELFNRKNIDLRLDQGCVLGQIVIKKFEY